MHVQSCWKKNCQLCIVRDQKFYLYIFMDFMMENEWAEPSKLYTLIENLTYNSERKNGPKSHIFDADAGVFLSQMIQFVVLFLLPLFGCICFFFGFFYELRFRYSTTCVFVRTMCQSLRKYTYCARIWVPNLTTEKKDHSLNWEISDVLAMDIV